jgi:hypothetical protein
VRRAVGDLADRYETFGYLTIMELTANLAMPSEIRGTFDAIIRRYTTRFSGAAIVYERQGFQATAVRSLVTAINFATRASHPTRVFDDLRQGIAWLSRLTPGEPTAARLTQIATQLRTNAPSYAGPHSVRVR